MRTYISIMCDEVMMCGGMVMSGGGVVMCVVVRGGEMRCVFTNHFYTSDAWNLIEGKFVSELGSVSRPT